MAKAIKKVKKIFVSHASKDKVITELFQDLILHGGLSVPITEIFNSTTNGTKIESGDDWREAIKENLNSAMIIFLIITPNYKESEVCLNEMGAAWMSEAKVIPLIVPPINYKTVGVLQEPKQIEKLLSDQSLDVIRDLVQTKLEIDPNLIKSARWTTKKKEFIDKVTKYINKNKFAIPMDRELFDANHDDNKKLKKKNKLLIKKNAELEKIIAELKLVKDKDSVKMIINKNFEQTVYQEFEELIKQVKENLSSFPAIIVSLIYKTYTGKVTRINTDGYEDDVRKAIANDYIYEDEDLDANFEDTKKMRNLCNALDNLRDFLLVDENITEIYEEFDDNYECDLIWDNKAFWEDVLGETIII